MKTLTLILAYIVIICAVWLPIWTIWYCIKVNCTTNIVFYLGSCTFIFSNMTIYMMYKCIKMLIR